MLCKLDFVDNSRSFQNKKTHYLNKKILGNRGRCDKNMLQCMLQSVLQCVLQCVCSVCCSVCSSVC
jgi:hypothetical protein